MPNIRRFLRLIYSWLGRARRLNLQKPEIGYSQPRNDDRHLAVGKKLVNSLKSPLQIIGGGAPEPSTRLEIFLLGRLRASFGNLTLERWPSRKGKFLFAYLILNRTRRISRDKLMEMFWPGSTPQSARNCLNVILHRVRQQLHTINDRHEIILYKNESYFINPKIEIRLDTEEFEKAWKEGRRRMHLADKRLRRSRSP